MTEKALESVFIKSEPQNVFMDEDEPVLSDSLHSQHNISKYDSTCTSEINTSSIVSKSVSINPFKCGVCGLCVPDDTSLRSHMKVHQVKRLHRCNMCNETFAFVRDLNRHILQHTEEKTGYTCPECEKECFTEDDLHEHIRIHTKEKPFKCKLCHRAFTHDFYLRIHERSHFSNLNYKHMNKVDIVKKEDSAVEMVSSSKVYECEECHKCFISEPYLKAHIELHKKITEEPELPQTKQTINVPAIPNAEDLNSAIEVNESSNNMLSAEKELPSCLSCRVCKKDFQDLLHLQLHETLHDEGEIVTNITSSTQCLVCSRNFNNLNDLLDHMKDLHPYHTMMDQKMVGVREIVDGKEKIMYKCNICGRSFPLPSKLKTHLMTHSGEKPFQCEQCLKYFRTAGSLRDHTMTHLEDKPFKCSICGKGFTKSSVLEDHIRKHTGEKPFDCNICQKKFATITILNQHLLGHAKEKPFKCDVCGKGFIFLCNLKNHMFTHTGERPFQCEVCQRGFTLRSSLRVHMMEHTGEKPFKCSTCSKTFTTIGSLKKHERVHTKEKPYTCKVCNKGFSQSSSLSRHMDVHTGQKPFMCNICLKGFTSGSYLKVHMKNHTRTEMLECDICLKKFDTQLQSRTHRATHNHKNRKQNCPRCSNYFRSASALQNHMLLHLEGRINSEINNREAVNGVDAINSSEVNDDEQEMDEDEKDVLKGDSNFKIDVKCNEKERVCHVCGVECSDKDELQHHLLEHLDVKPLVCDNCTDVFSDNNSLDSHVLKCHRNKEKS